MRASNVAVLAEVQGLPYRKGRPLLLSDKLDHQVQEYIKELHMHGVAINSAIAIAMAQGIIMNKDANLLSCNGGDINSTTTTMYITDYMIYLNARKQ